MPFQYGEDEAENTRLQRMMDSEPEQSESGQESDGAEVSSSSQESEGPSMDDVKASLIDRLGSIKEARTWSSYGPIEVNSPTPGLYLKKDGIVGLPLTGHDASRIKRQASRGSAINKSLAYELNPGQFEMRNPTWHAFVQSVGLNATKPFDIGTVHLTLRKLILCDKSSGSFVREEPSKDFDVIGSMAIVLSSRHEGGDIKLTYGNETKRFSTAPTSDFNESFVAWYSDVQVDAEPITSGYRLQLMYDLHASQTIQKIISGKPSASHVSQQINKFRDLLGQWTALSQRHQGPVPLVYILDDEPGDYKRRLLSCASLKDADKHKLLFLQRQCPEKDVCVYLAKLRTCIDENIGYYQEPSTTMELHEITDIDGHMFIKDEVSIEKENLVQEDCFEERDSNDSDYDTPEPSDPWEEVEPGMDENTRNFKDWVFVLLPASQRLNFFAKNTSPEDLQTWIVRLSNGLKNPDNVVPQSGSNTAGDMLQQSQEELTKELNVVCACVIDKMRSWHKDSMGLTSYLYHRDNPKFAKALETVVRAAMILGNSDFVREAMIECPTKLSHSLWREIGGCLDHSTLIKYKYGLNLALRQIPTIHGKNLVLESIVSGYRETPREASKEETLLDQWVQDRLRGALNALEIVEEQDGRALISIGEKHGRDVFINQVIPFAKRHASNLPFAADFVSGVSEEAATEAFQPDMVPLALREVFSVMVPALTIETGNTSAKRRKIAQTSSTSVGHNDMDRWPLAGSRIARLIGCCLASDLKDEEKHLLNRIASEASNADERTLDVILMPFLQTLRQIMEQNSVAFTTQDYQNLFQYIIALFIIEYVKMEPSRPVNQTCPKAGCGADRQCQDCWNLDEFLRHPIRQTWDLTTTGQRRDHVERRVLVSQSPYFRCHTIKNRHAPHTLKVIKTLNQAWEANHSAWLSRCAKAEEALAAIGHDALKQLLGNKYNECLELRSVRHRLMTVIPERPSPRTKGRTQIIDLSEY